MTRLRALGLANHYRSDRENVVADFYVPALSVATGYDRAVGYFTATSLALVSRGVDALVANGGTMRLVASPKLDEEDIFDINRGYDVREVLERSAIRALDDVDDERLLAGLGRLGRLIADKKLEVKLAYLRTPRGYGMYHEKIGLLRDAAGDVVAFSGSANETFGGLVANFETVEVFGSWHDADRDRVLRIDRDFDALWRDVTPTLRVLPFPEVGVERLLALARRPAPALPETDDAFDPVLPLDREPGHGRLRPPPGLTFREYQKDAVRAWFAADGHGILKMATGTGKTKTALAAAAQLARVFHDRDLRLVTLVVAPLKHLVDQWVDEVAEFGVRAVAAYESTAAWTGRAHEAINAVNLGAVDGAVIVTTNDTLRSEALQAALRRATQPLLVIGDELHNLGSAQGLASLPDHAAYRLGLSATPERWFDDAGTAALEAFFGPVVFELGLGQAIELGALCHYTYHPRVVPLDEDEAAMYAKLSQSIGALMASGNARADDEDGALGALLRKRSQVLGHARGKLGVFRRDVEARRDRWFQLTYCAEGYRPTEHGAGDEPRQLDEVVRLVGIDVGLSVNKYVSETPRPKRRELLRRFGSGDDLQMLVSMRCLDEGVDIPDARVAYLLASSSNPRQFIQRRGRILRPAPGKTTAEIVDYVVVPPPSVVREHFDTERALVGRELSRTTEFAQLADNYGAALEALRPVKQEFGLMDV